MVGDGSFLCKPRDTAVDVLEVVRLPAAQRVRARIAHPPGWISIEQTSDGFRWARPEHSALPNGPLTDLQLAHTGDRYGPLVDGQPSIGSGPIGAGHPIVDAAFLCFRFGSADVVLALRGPQQEDGAVAQIVNGVAVPHRAAFGPTGRQNASTEDWLLFSPPPFFPLALVSVDVIQRRLSRRCQLEHGGVRYDYDVTEHDVRCEIVFSRRCGMLPRLLRGWAALPEEMHTEVCSWVGARRAILADRPRIDVTGGWGSHTGIFDDVDAALRWARADD